jgi:hypothetical protein
METRISCLNGVKVIAMNSYKILFHPSQQKFVIRKTTSFPFFYFFFPVLPIHSSYFSILTTKQTLKLEVFQASLRCLAGISIKIALPDHAGMMRYRKPLFQ